MSASSVATPKANTKTYQLPEAVRLAVRIEKILHNQAHLSHGHRASAPHRRGNQRTIKLTYPRPNSPPDRLRVTRPRRSTMRLTLDRKNCVGSSLFAQIRHNQAHLSHGHKASAPHHRADPSTMKLTFPRPHSPPGRFRATKPPLSTIGVTFPLPGVLARKTTSPASCGFELLGNPE